MFGWRISKGKEDELMICICINNVSTWSDKLCTSIDYYRPDSVLFTTQVYRIQSFTQHDLTIQRHALKPGLCSKKPAKLFLYIV